MRRVKTFLPHDRFCDSFPELDSHTVSWDVNPFKYELVGLPEEAEELAENLIELRSSSETRMKFETKGDLGCQKLQRLVKLHI